MTGRQLGMYLVWLGAWNRSNPGHVRTMALLTHMAKYISSTGWADTNRLYYQQRGADKGKQYAKGELVYKGSAIVPAPAGMANISDMTMQGGQWSEVTGGACWVGSCACGPGRLAGVLMRAGPGALPWTCSLAAVAVAAVPVTGSACCMPDAPVALMMARRIPYLRSSLPLPHHSLTWHRCV